MTDFFGDEWFETMADKGILPFSSMWERPLTNDIATIIFVERAVRIALLPPTTRDDLATEARTQYDRAFFDHLDILLEVAGLGLREGWQSEPCPTLESGRNPDLRLTRPGMRFTVEVTTCGLDRETINADTFQMQFQMRLLELQDKCGVELVAQSSVPTLDEETVANLFKSVEEASHTVIATGTPETITVPGMTALVYRAGDRPYGTIGKAPRPQVDPSDRLVKRIVKKAEQTTGAGPTWIRVDESAQLFMFSRLDRMSPGDQLAYLIRRFQPELERYSHVRGVVLSFGAEPFPSSTQRQCHVVDSGRPDPWTGPVMLDRALPGPRRRRTFIIPIEGGQRLVLPGQVDLVPSRWYEAEGGWLDWALQRLHQPLSSNFLSPTGAVAFDLGALGQADNRAGGA